MLIRRGTVRLKRYSNPLQMADTKGCHTFAVGTGSAGTTCLAVAVRKSVYVYEVYGRHTRGGD